MHHERSELSHWIGGIALGAGLMYVLDPQRGRRRRAVIRDKAYSFWNRSGDALDATARNLRDEGVGLMAKMKSRMRPEEEVSDEVLHARVRSAMGRAVSHPSSIEVTVDQGRVTLTGPVLRKELRRLLSTVNGVRGVREVENRMEVHDEPGSVPGLQGGGTRTAQYGFMQSNWSPAMRALATFAGSGLAVFGASRGGAMGALSVTASAAILTRAFTNMEMRRITGLGAGRRAVDIQKTINIEAPVEEVFRFWEQFDNFPKFMSHLKEVRTLHPGRSHWVAYGPAGVPVEWDAVITRHEPNHLISWRSEPGSAVQTAGTVRFEPNQARGCKVEILMSYNPVAGAIGHAVASLFGVDPKNAMDDDLVRLKTLFEQGGHREETKNVGTQELPSPSSS